jgi:hypothetical protein
MDPTDLFCRKTAALIEATGYSLYFIRGIRRWSRNQPDNPFRGRGAHPSMVVAWVVNHPDFAPGCRAQECERNALHRSAE